MTSSTIDDTTPARARRTGSPAAAIAGGGALAASAAAVVTFGDPMAGSDTAADAATALSASSAQPAALLVGIYALLALAVAGSLAARLGRSRDSGAVRLIPVLAAVHLLLMTLFIAAPAAAVTVGTLVLDGGVSPVAAEAALLVMNVVHPVAGWFGAGFLIAVAIAAHTTGASRTLVVVTTLFALGLLVPPVAWIVTYLMGVWFAGVSIWLWLRR
jgi:hypothetical protein